MRGSNAAHAMIDYDGNIKRQNDATLLLKIYRKFHDFLTLLLSTVLKPYAAQLVERWTGVPEGKWCSRSSHQFFFQR